MNAADAYTAYLQAVRVGDRRRALATIERAQEAGLGLRELYLDVLQPVMREIGRLWQENEMTVAEEHLATAITMSAMLRLSLHTVLADGAPRLMIAACSETERHEIGLRMLCDLLDAEGWETVFLGPSVPAESLERMVRKRKPHVVALSASITPHLPQLRATIAALRVASGGDGAPLFLVGGRPFVEQAELAQAVGADLTARDAAEAVAAIVARFP